MLIAGTTPGTHSGWVLQGKFQEPGAVRPQERLVRAAVIEANFQIPFVSSLPKPAKLQTLSPSGPNPEQALEHLGDGPLTPSICLAES